MPVIEVTVNDKIATKTCNTEYVCGNSDFVVSFTFDKEWTQYNTKTARFVYNGEHEDVVFEGNNCPVPIISDTIAFEVGVYAGNLHTTTPACVRSRKSILCGSGVPADPAPDVYAQIMEKLNSMNLTSGYDPFVAFNTTGSVAVAESVELTFVGTWGGSDVDWLSYSIVQNYNTAKVFFDGVEYTLPILMGEDITETLTEQWFIIGDRNWTDPKTPPFAFVGYEGNEFSMFTCTDKKPHTVSVYLMNQSLEGYAKTVNGVEPDENGNVEIQTLPNDLEQISMLIDTDLLPAVHDADGAILTDENGNVILRY